MISLCVYRISPTVTLVSGTASESWLELVTPSAIWFLIVESIPNRESVLREVELTQEAFENAWNLSLSIARSRVVMALLLSFALYTLIRWFFRPFQHIRQNHEVGYLPEQSRQTNEERAADVRRRRRVGDLPPVYPNGWFRLLDSRQLECGQSKQVSALGLELAVFRSESGVVAILDAYCPHLGANLAAGGNVEGENIHCPFHGWQFNTSGACVKIPYCEGTPPANAKVRSYPSLDTNGQILLWFDAEGREPYWYPPALPAVNDGSWRFCGETMHVLNCHIEEVPENAADVPHLEYLHGPFMINEKGLKFLRHVWTASWAPCEEEGKKHISILHLLHQAYIFGIRFPPLDFAVVAEQAPIVGPGLVYLTWKSLLGAGCFVQTLTPVEPLLQHLGHCVYAAWTVPTFLAKFYMFGEVVQVERDVMVWNNKMYRSNPVLCKNDSLIKKHRAWFSQFFSENSPTYDSVNSKSW